MKAVGIIWDTDGADVELPDEIELPANIDEDDYDAIDNYLSDVTGFCHLGYELEL